MYLFTLFIIGAISSNIYATMFEKEDEKRDHLKLKTAFGLSIGSIFLMFIIIIYLCYRNYRQHRNIGRADLEPLDP